jgi:hypothetical protein
VHKSLRFGLALTAAVMFLAIQSPVPAPAAATFPYEFTFNLPSGAPMAESTVTVVLEPFDPPSAYVSPVIAQGSTEANGAFGFDLSTDSLIDAAYEGARETLDIVPEAAFEEADNLVASYLGTNISPDAKEGIVGEGASINAVVRAVNPEHTWLAEWNVVIPLQGKYEETFAANLDLTTIPGVGEMSDAALTGRGTSITTCLPATEDEGFDQMLFNLEDDTGGLSGNLTQTPHPTDICPVSIEPGALPADNSTGTPQFQENCDDPTWHGCAIAMKRRWAAIAEWHVARGMQSDLYYGAGSHDTNSMSMINHGGGWQVGGWNSELFARDNSAGVTKDGAYHRYRVAQYQYNKYRRCDYEGNVLFCTDKWLMARWTGGFSKRSNVEAHVPSLNKQAGFRLRDAWFATSNTRQHAWGAGVYILGGIGVGTQSGFSETTKLTWRPTQGCEHDRWLWGSEGKYPSNAGTIYATCQS